MTAHVRAGGRCRFRFASGRFVDLPARRQYGSPYRERRCGDCVTFAFTYAGGVGSVAISGRRLGRLTYYAVHFLDEVIRGEWLGQERGVVVLKVFVNR